MTGTQPSGRTRLIATLLLWLPWMVSILPFFVLFFEFHCAQLGACGKEWWYYAKFYSHFFLYPITFGLISTALLHRPWVRSIHYLRSLSGPARTRKVGFIVTSVLTVVSFAGYMEFASKPSIGVSKECRNLPKFAGATPAPWSLAPDAIKDKEEGRRIRALLSERCQGGSASLSEPEKCDFREDLSILWEDSGRRLSYTEHSYRAGFIAMTILFAFLFLTILVVRAWDSQDRSDSENKPMMTLLSLALFFATFWVLMRFTFLLEKLSLYQEDPLLMYNAFIFLTFLVVYIHHVASRWSTAEPYEKRLELLLSIAAGAIAVVGFFIDHLPAMIPDAFIRTFGTGSSPGTYMVLLLFLVVVHFPHILRYLDEEGKRDGSDRPGTT